ncbi:MAG: CBS domain-containing protein [Burkholderiales bacterium]
MKKLLDRSAAVIGLALFSPVAFAFAVEDAQTFVGEAGLYVLILSTIATIAFVYFRQLPDRHAATLQAILSDEAGVTHSVQADALVVECVRKMTDNKIGALMVMDAGKLVGIFSERDALSRVLAAGRDPRDTRVVEVMTTNPYCVSPGMTVGDAMELVTKKRFRHLPIVEDGKVEALLSSGDLTHWLVKNRGRDVQDLVELANRS